MIMSRTSNVETAPAERQRRRVRKEREGEEGGGKKSALTLMIWRVDSFLAPVLFSAGKP